MFTAGFIFSASLGFSKGLPLHGKVIVGFGLGRGRLPTQTVDEAVDLEGVGDFQQLSLLILEAYMTDIQIIFNVVVLGHPQIERFENRHNVFLLESSTDLLQLTANTILMLLLVVVQFEGHVFVYQMERVFIFKDAKELDETGYTQILEHFYFFLSKVVFVLVSVGGQPPDFDEVSVVHRMAEWVAFFDV